MVVLDIPMGQIYSDPVFNSRGSINQSDVVDLARNIDTHGLLQPITIQPYTDMPGYIYRIVAGHRRHAAYQHLGRTTIPSIIREHLSEIDAFVINFAENVNRQDLNLLQEAQGVERFLKAGMTNKQIGALINKGSGWVQVRSLVLRLPEVVQKEAAVGTLTQSHIQQISSLKNTERQIDAVKTIKEAKLRGEKRLPPIKVRKVNPTVLKRRSPEEIYGLIELIIETMGEGNVVTRTLAWCNGEISDLDLYRDLKEYAISVGKTFKEPIEAQNYLRAI